MRLLVTRSRPDAEAQAERLRARGHQALVEPLIEIVYRDAGRLALEGVQALAATSRNGLRALARNEALERARKLPLFAVGEATGEMARQSGFTQLHCWEGRAEGMAAWIAEHASPRNGAILHLAGSRLAADLKDDLERLGFAVDQPKLYDSAAVPAFSDGLRNALVARALDGVLLMSPFTARCWVELAGAASVCEQAGKLRHYCLSAAVAEALGGFAGEGAAIAETPAEDDLLALIDREAAH